MGRETDQQEDRQAGRQTDRQARREGESDRVDETAPSMCDLSYGHRYT